jgi:hypothetical protein
VTGIDAIAGGGDDAFSFIGGAAFSAAGQIRVIQSGADTLIQFNIAGSDGAEMTILLANFTASKLTVGDFDL